MARHIAGGAYAKRIPLPRVLILGIDAARCIGAAEESELSVKPRIGAFECIHLNDSAHLPPIFSGNSGGIDFKGFNVSGFDFRAEAWRTVVGERNSVYNKLRLILRSARVENGITFIKPAGF